MEQYIKYPRTLHLPWSLGSTNDDKFMPNVEHFNGKRIVIHVKIKNKKD